MANQEELQKAFMAYLIQDAQAQGIQLQSEQDLQAYAEQLGEDGIKAKYQEFIIEGAEFTRYETMWANKVCAYYDQYGMA